MPYLDTTAPELTSFTFTRSVDVTKGSVTIPFFAQATDNQELSRVQIVLDRPIIVNFGENAGRGNTADVFTSEINLGLGTASGASSGVFSTTATIAAAAIAGSYQITEIRVFDRTGNVRVYAAADVPGLKESSSFTVASTVSDATAPTLLGLALPNVLDVREGADDASFAVRATDEGGGVDRVVLRLNYGLFNAEGGALISAVTISGSSTAFAAGEASKVLNISSSSGNGAYRIAGATVYDKSGNSRSYSLAQLADLGVRTSFDVLSDTAADRSAPTITSLSLPSTVDVTNGSAAATFKLEASDGDGLGVSQVTLDLDYNLQGASGPIGRIILKQDEAGTLAGTEEIARSTGVGAYTIKSALIVDKAGNSRFYSAAALESIGVSQFNVVDAALAPITSVETPAVVVEGNDMSAGLTLSLTKVNDKTVNQEGVAELSLLLDRGGADALDARVPTQTVNYTVKEEGGRFFIVLPPVALLDDTVAEGTETIFVQVRASGQLFANGTDTTVAEITLVDNDQRGGDGVDRLAGTDGRDQLAGVGGDDDLAAGAGDDTLFGGDGNDRLDGGLGADRIEGGAGDDVYVLDEAGDVWKEAANAGVDTVLSGVSLKIVDNFENLVLTGSTDLSGSGNNAANAITGNVGANLLKGLNGADTLTGGLGDDRLEGGLGFDAAVFASTLAQNAFAFEPGGVAVLGPEGRDSLIEIEQLRFDDAVLSTGSVASVSELYQRWGGRAVAGTEVAYWLGELAAGRVNLTGIKNTILADPLGKANTARVVGELYGVFIGRAPDAAELSFWDARVRAGVDFAGVRAVLVADPSGQAFTGGRVAGLYAEHLGRAPGAGELAFWLNEVRIGTDFSGVRAALVNDPAGRAYTAAVVGELYRDYGGREASADEVAFWDGQVRAGSSFADVRGAILGDPLGRTYTTGALEGLYQELFGRSAATAEQAVWNGLFRGGADLDTARAALTADGGSDGRVERFTGGAGADSFVFEAGDRHQSVTGFDPLLDKLDLRGSGFTTYAAREIRTLEDGTDVLVTLDATHDVLLRGLTLAQLGAEDVLI